MKFTVIGNTDVKVSQIGLGTWQFGSKGWGFESDFNKADAISIVHKALDSGINLIDTAEAYGRGESERIVGEAIKGYDREKIVLSTKFLPTAVRPSAVVRALKKSLDRLDTDFIDIYLIHWPAPWLPLGRTLKNMEKMVDEGLIRYIGVSNFSKGKLSAAQAKTHDHRIQLNQVNYSIARNGAEKDLLPYAQINKITIMAYSPLAQGWLTGNYSHDHVPKGIRRRNRLFTKRNFKRGKELLGVIKEVSENHQVTMAQVALNWVVRNPSVVAIPGAKSIAQLEANTRSLDFEFSKAEIDRIKKAYSGFQPRRFL